MNATHCSATRAALINLSVCDRQQWHHCTLCICGVFSQVCDSDTVLDPACTIEMLKILEEDPMVGGVGGDVQVKYKRNDSQLTNSTT